MGLVHKCALSILLGGIHWVNRPKLYNYYMYLSVFSMSLKRQQILLSYVTISETYMFFLGFLLGQTYRNSYYGYSDPSHSYTTVLFH